jgi:DNA replication licensing factor MCM3
MDGIQLRDEAVRDRIRAAQEFLDPSTLNPMSAALFQYTNSL